MPPHPLERLWTLVLIVLLALACLVLVGPLTGLAQARTVYVATTGNDTRPCTQAHNPATPRRTVNAGLACLAGGDTLMLGDGIYHEQLADTDARETPGAIRPPPGLSWSQPTTIKAANPRQAILDKPAPGDPYNYVLFLARPETQYVVIEGLVLDGRGRGDCVWVGPSSHIRLQNNVIKNCGGNGIYGAVDDHGGGGTDIQILDNEIFNVALEHDAPPGMHGVYFTGSNSVARQNYVHAPCPFYGLHYTSEKGGLHDNVLESNRVVGCLQAGIISQGTETIIRNNLLEHNCIGIYLTSASTKVFNNTIYGYKFGPNCPDSYGIFDKGGGSSLVNNLVLKQLDVSYAPTYIYALGAPGLTANLCDAQQPQNCQLSAPAAAVVVDGPRGNLTPVPGGPAINAGVARAEVPTDRLGVPRPQGGRYDIGAYEYTTQAPPIDPPPIDPPGGTPPPVAGTPLACVGIQAPSGVMAVACTPEPARR